MGSLPEDAENVETLASFKLKVNELTLIIVFALSVEAIFKG